jgi:hypothetical protein
VQARPDDGLYLSHYSAILDTDTLRDPGLLLDRGYTHVQWTSASWHPAHLKVQ